MNESILLVVKAVAVMGALGAVFGLVLGFASKVFAVEKDDGYVRITVIDAHGDHADTNAYFTDEIL